MGKTKSKLVKGDAQKGAMDEQVAKFHASRGKSKIGAGPSQYGRGGAEGQDSALETKKPKKNVAFYT